MCKTNADVRTRWIIGIPPEPPSLAMIQPEAATQASTSTSHIPSA